MLSFSSNSTIHGINFIFNKSQSRISRIFWSVALTCSFLGFCYYIYEATNKLHLYPDIVLKVTQRPLSELPFPAVTVCTPIFSLRNFANFRPLGNETFRTHFRCDSKPCDYREANAHWCQNSILSAPNNQHVCCPKNRSINIVKLMEESSFQVGDIIRFQKNFVNKETALKQYFKVMTDRGFCYSLNMLNHDKIFNPKISKDFDSYKRRIETSSDSRNHQPSVDWSIEGGYENGKLFF